MSSHRGKALKVGESGTAVPLRLCAASAPWLPSHAGAGNAPHEVKLSLTLPRTANHGPCCEVPATAHAWPVCWRGTLFGCTDCRPVVWDAAGWGWEATGYALERRRGRGGFGPGGGGGLTLLLDNCLKGFGTGKFFWPRLLVGCGWLLLIPGVSAASVENNGQHDTKHSTDPSDS